MKRVNAIGVAVALGIIAFSVVFSYPAFRPVTVPWYAPMDREWRLAAEPGAATDLAMDFYGRLLYGVVAGSMVGLLAYPIVRRFGRDPGPESFTPVALTANAFIFLLLCAFFFSWTLARRQLEGPPPLPFERSSLVAPIDR